MDKFKYRIVLYTPIGKRSGQLTMDTSREPCSGILSMFGTEAPVTVRVDDHGRISLTGRVHTLLHERTFEANGEQHADRMELMFRSGALHCRMIGQREE